MKNVIILCSGGIDSVTTAYYARNKLNYDKIILLFFDYGQKSINIERRCAKNTAKKLGAKFREIKIAELGELSTSLINKKGKVKNLELNDLKDTRKEGAKWYVPFRNAVFLVYALAFAESIFVRDGENYDLFVGFKSDMGEGYPDTSLKFLNDIERIGKYSKANGFRIKAPFIDKEKEDIISLGNKLGIDFKESFSCYVGRKMHCGTCLACRLRQEGFYWANIKDPTEYKEKPNDLRLA